MSEERLNKGEKEKEGSSSKARIKWGPKNVEELSHEIKQLEELDISFKGSEIISSEIIGFIKLALEKGISVSTAINFYMRKKNRGMILLAQKLCCT
jgi:ribosomal protein S25